MNETGAVTAAKAKPAFDKNVGAAISRDVTLLARLHDREVDAELLEQLRAAAPATWFAMRLSGPAFGEACRLMTKALSLDGEESEANLDDLAADFAAIYLTHGYRVSPNESVWRDEEGLERQGPMFSVRAWYKHHNLQTPDWRIRADDHLVNELQFLALLSQRAADFDQLREAARFLREHPLVWVKDFGGRVVQRCRTPFYAAAALMTVTYLDRLAELFAALLDMDMTPATLAVAPARAGLPSEPTCADPPPQNTPAFGPSW